MRVALLLVALTLSAHAADTSVLVTTQPPKKGALPDIVVAYGTVAPALSDGMTLSVPQAGRVQAIHVTPGEVVRAGAALIDFAASAAASSAYRQAVSAVSFAHAKRKHTAELLHQQLATRDQLAAAEKAVLDAQSALDALRREGGGTPRRTLTAPFAAIVAAIKVAQGDRVAADTPLMILNRENALVVTAGIQPDRRARVTAGEPARIEPVDGGAAFDGHVLRVDGRLNPRTRLVDADLSVPEGALSGEAVRAAITVGQFRGWLVPHSAVLSHGKGLDVFQVRNGHAALIPVTLVGSAGGTDVVAGPIEPALPLVVQGNYQLSDGIAVRTDTGQ